MTFPTLQLAEARRFGICRVCRGPANPRRVVIPTRVYATNAYLFTPIKFLPDHKVDVHDKFVTDYGREYAHASCLSRIDLEEFENG